MKDNKISTVATTTIVKHVGIKKLIAGKNKNLSITLMRIETALNVNGVGTIKDCGDWLSIIVIQMKKKFSIDKNRGKNKEELYKELDKCDVLCHNCHSEIHAEMRGDLT